MTTDTAPLAPTDAELMDLGHECELDAIEFGRAVLAKWGTPAPVGVEPVARLEIGKTKGGVSLTHIAEPAAFQLQEGMYALYTAPQPVEREPLTREQVKAICVESGYETAALQERADFINGIRHAERHHGIGGQHGTE